MILLAAIVTIAIVLAYAVACAIYEVGRRMDDD